MQSIGQQQQQSNLEQKQTRFDCTTPLENRNTEMIDVA